MTTKRLAVDACAALHAKQTNALVVLEHLIRHGADIAMSGGVHGEAVQMSLRDWLGRTSILPQRVRREETRAVRNRCHPRRMPGKKDIELVALARRDGAPVLTHDQAAAEASRHVGLIAVDLCDVIAFAARQGWVSQEELARLSAALGHHAWRAPDWKGDVAATIEGRPRYERTAAALRALLD